MANIREIKFPPKNQPTRWLKLAGLAILVVILVSMLAGILINPKGSDRAASTISAGNLAPASSIASNPIDRVSTSTEASGAMSAPALNAQSQPSGASASSGAGKAAAPVANSTGGNSTLPSDQLVIRNGTVSLTAKDVDKTILDLRALAIEKNGSVIASNTQMQSSGTYANLTLQVPSNTFDDVLNRVQQMEGVTIKNENTTSQDVSEEYVDVQAQINNLKVTETELNALLSKATNLNDVLTLRQQISTVRGEIDQRQARINYLDKHTSMSSLTFTITPVVVPATVVTPPATTEPAWDAGAILSDAWNGSMRGMQRLYTVLITFGVWGIWLGPIMLAIVLLSLHLYRRFMAQRDVASSITTVATTSNENAA